MDYKEKQRIAKAKVKATKKSTYKPSMGATQYVLPNGTGSGTTNAPLNRK